MSTAAGRTARLLNTHSRPVELHLSTGIAVVPPLGEVHCRLADLALGQVRALCASGVLVPRVVEPEPASETEAPQAGRRSSRRRARSAPSSPSPRRRGGGTSDTSTDR